MIDTWSGGMFQSLSYRIRVPGQIWIIDCGLFSEELAASCAGQEPVSIFLTHGHIDHICAVDAWRQALSGRASVWIHRLEAEALPQAKRNLSAVLGCSQQFAPADKLFESGVISMHGGYALTALHTPGHTAGSTCFLLSEGHDDQAYTTHIPTPKGGRAVALFSGDTLFAGSIGRMDLGGDPVAMRASLNLLEDLANQLALHEKADLTVYAGHGCQTALWHEIRTNPYFRMRNSLD